MVKEGWCFGACGGKYGPCEDHCGKNNFCCQKDKAGCTDELKNVIPDGAQIGSKCVGWKGQFSYCVTSKYLADPFTEPTRTLVLLGGGGSYSDAPHM